MHETYMSVDQ